MGRTLLVAAALAIGAGRATAQTPTPAPPPTPTPTPTSTPTPTAADLFKQGQELASRGDFVTAMGALTRALELEPSNREIKLALADAERQSNQCDKAIPRYKELLEGASEADKARVKASVQQCPNAVVIEPPAPPPPPVALPPAPPEPTVITREGSPSGLTVGIVAGAGLCFGGAVGMYLAARGSDRDADEARSFADHESISTRADRERIAAVVLLGGAVGLGAYAVYRIKFRSHQTTEVALTPTADGGAMFVRGSW